MKLLGTVLLALGCGMFCADHISAERRKTKALQEMAQAVSFMAGEIRCSLMPLPRLVRLCREKCGREAAGFFRAVEKALSEGESLEQAWGKGSLALELPEGGKETVAALGSAFGHDEEAVLRQLDEAQRQLRAEAAQRKSAQREKEKLCAALCFSAAGLLWLTVI